MSFLLAASLIAFCTVFSSLSISKINHANTEIKHNHKHKQSEKNQLGFKDREKGDYREFDAQCFDTLGEACVANLSIFVEDLAWVSECSSPSPFQTDPRTQKYIYKEKLGIGKIESYPQKLLLENKLFKVRS